MAGKKNRNKAKGSTYERELVARLQETGLIAKRVPLSGAMAGYPGDIIVGDKKETSLTLEAKYSMTGAGFKKLVGWCPDDGVLEVSGLRVYAFSVWTSIALYRYGGDKIEPIKPIKRESPMVFQFILDAFDQGEKAADFVVVRMPKQQWYFVEKLKEKG